MLIFKHIANRLLSVLSIAKGCKRDNEIDTQYALVVHLLIW